MRKILVDEVNNVAFVFCVFKKFCVDTALFQLFPPHSTSLDFIVENSWRSATAGVDTRGCSNPLKPLRMLSLNQSHSMHSAGNVWGRQTGNQSNTTTPPQWMKLTADFWRSFFPVDFCTCSFVLLYILFVMQPVVHKSSDTRVAAHVDKPVHMCTKIWGWTHNFYSTPG